MASGGGRRERPSSSALWSTLYDELATEGSDRDKLTDQIQGKGKIVSLYGEGGEENANAKENAEVGLAGASATVTTDSSETKSNVPKTAVFNSALRFTPTIRKSASNVKSVLPIPVPVQLLEGEGEPMDRSGSMSSDPAAQTIASSSHRPYQAASQATKSSIPPAVIVAEPVVKSSSDDVNGFLSAPIGQMSKKRNSKKRKSNVIEHADRPSWDDEYNPLRPTDYEEWKAHVRRQREEARYRVAQKSRPRSDEREREKSVYSEDEEDEDVIKTGHVVVSEESPIMMEVDESGDAAYARRLAMSQAKEPVFEPVRTAVSVASSITVVKPSIERGRPAEIDDKDDRQRKIDAGKAAATELAAKFSKSSTSDSSHPQLGHRMSTAELAALARHAGIQHLSSKTESQIENELAKAHAEEVSSNSKPDPRKFAERLMQKYGWKKGSGLGKDEAGIKHALTIEKVKSDSNKTVNPNQRGGEEEKRPKPVIAQVRNREAERLKEEEERKYGSPSRVVLMTNVVSPQEALEDEELAQEIGEECAKMGPIERCFIYVVPPSLFSVHDLEETLDPTSDGVRVFVVYTGLVGAWRACREFSGRWFGGREMRCRFWSEDLFRRGTYVI